MYDIMFGQVNPIRTCHRLAIIHSQRPPIKQCAALRSYVCCGHAWGVRAYLLLRAAVQQIVVRTALRAASAGCSRQPPSSGLKY